MRVPRLSPARFRQITLVAAVAVAFIIVTGGAVRITGSGLGCPDWPTCDDSRIVAPLEYHAMVEFVNRTVTGLVSLAVIVAVLGSLVRQPRRRDLTWLSLGLVAGVVAQIILGGLTVLFELKPQFVMSHFLLSLVLLADAVVLYYRSGLPDGQTARPVVSPDLVWMGRVVVLAAAVAIFLGTVVTGAGPHGGDPDVERLRIAVPDAARLHGLGAMLFLTVTLVTLWRLHRAGLRGPNAVAGLRGPNAVGGAPAAVMRAGEILLGVSVAQAAVGYTQYFTGVPVVLVGIHIAGAAAVWAAAVWFLVGLSRVPAAGSQTPSRPEALTRP